MPTKRTSIKETKAHYHTQRKPSRGVRAQITLEWADVERAATPIVLERDGQPAAVVMRYADYQQWGAPSCTVAPNERQQLGITVGSDGGRPGNPT